MVGIISVVYLAFQNLTLTYTISGQGVIYPYREWVLAKNTDGNLINILRNNHTNSIVRYSVTEFQRGDLAQFEVHERVFDHPWVHERDTVGWIYSSKEVLKLIELEGELEAQNKLLALYASGEKPEEVQAAFQRMVLARQQYETQKRITERNRTLFELGHIAAEEYEISENEYHNRYQNYLIAQSQHEAMLSGAKQEQLDYIRANISSLEQNINHLRNVIESFTITSPISGKILRKQGNNPDYDAILRVVDTTRFVVLIPVELYNMQFLETGQAIEVISAFNGSSSQAVIFNFDNSVQTLNQRQHIFVSAEINSDQSEGIYTDMLVDVRMSSEPISLFQYIRRFMNEIYNN